jgi:hypothetical protein
LPGNRVRAMMAQWRRPQFAALALLAILALLLPSLAWACPVTGRTGAAETVCLHPANGGRSTTLMPCCAHMAQMQRDKCCKPTSQLPSSDNGKDTSLAQPHADSRSILTHLTQAAHAVVDTTMVYSLTPLSVEPPHGSMLCDIAVGTPFTFQHAPPLTAGRAPPSV